MSNIDFEQCMETLLQRDNLQKLSAMLHIPSKQHWNDAFVSAPTFFENKTGLWFQIYTVFYRDL